MWSVLEAASSTPIEVNLRPYSVAIVTVPAATVHLAALPILEILDDFAKQPDSFVSLTGNSQELSLVSSSPDVVGRFRLFAHLVHIDVGWRVFQVEMTPEELSAPGGTGGSGVLVQQISRVLGQRGVSIYYTASLESDFFLCRSSEYGVVCAALSHQGWLGRTSTDTEAPLDIVPDLYLDSPLPGPRIVDAASSAWGSSDDDEREDPLSTDIVLSRWLDCGSASPPPTDVIDATASAFESASEDISSASPTAAQTLFPRPPAQKSPFNVRISFKSSFGLVGTTLSSGATKSFLQRWFLGDASDHPFFSIVGADEDSSGHRALTVACFGNASTVERFAGPGSVAPDDLDDAEAACRSLFQMDHARRASAPVYRSTSVEPAPVPTPVAGGRPPLSHRYSLPLSDLTFVDEWLQGVEPSLAQPAPQVDLSEQNTPVPPCSDSSGSLGVTRVWGSLELHLFNSDGLHRPGIISSYTDKLTHAGIDILCFSTGNSVNILVPQPKLLLARRILQVGH